MVGRILNQAHHFRDDLEKHSLEAPLKDVIAASVELQSSSKHRLCQVTSAGCSESLAAFENGSLLKREIQFTLACELWDTTTSYLFGFTDTCRCGQSQIHTSVLSECQQLHLEIHTVPPSSQDQAVVIRVKISAACSTSPDQTFSSSALALGFA